MHFFSVATIFLLVSLISACSSGSSNDPDASASTNTVPTDNSSSNTESSEASEDDPTNTSGPDEPEGNPDNTETIPTIDPESSLGQLQNRIQILTGRPLIALNQKLRQGELLTDQENNCLGAYDPAVGDSLLAIQCDQALAIGDVAIFTGVAAFEDSPGCQTSLQNASANECVVEQADMQINTLFVAQESGRPQPNAGATISYNIEQGQLVMENLPDALSGAFRCQVDVVTGNSNNDQQIGNCDAEVARMVSLIDQHLIAAD